MLEKFDYITTSVGVIAVLIFLFLYNKIRTVINHVFGDLDKMEFGGLVFTGILIYMLVKEGNRPHEWHLYSESTYFFIGVVAITGLGLNKALNVLRDIKLGATDSKSAPKEITQ